MKLSSRRFTVEEFPEQQSWIGKFIAPMNQFIQEVFSGLNNNITIADNLRQEIRELKFVNDASNLPLKFKTKFNQLPKGLYIIYCVDSDGGTASGNPWLTWSFNDGQLTVSNITNLTASKTYTLRILVIYE